MSITIKKNAAFAGRLSAIHLNSSLRFCGRVLLALAWLALSAAPAQATTYALGTATLLVGPSAGTNSVVLAVTPATGTWTATTNATWLHLSPANQSGTGSTNVIFSYDANSGATRFGTLTIAGETLTVTQAGSTYVAAGPVTTLSTGLSGPNGVAVDSAGNVYIADTGHNAIEMWTMTNNTTTTLVSTGLSGPQGVAVDGADNVYIADTSNNAIEMWTVTNNTLTTLVSTGLSGPQGVAVDGAGNVYIADTGNNAVEMWTVANSNMTTLVSTGSVSPNGVAVDGAGNVYIAGNFGFSGYGGIAEWTVANGQLTTLVDNGLQQAESVAVDGAGNLYIADTIGRAIRKWTAANSNVTTLVTVSSGLNFPQGVAVDGVGNVYIANTGNNAMEELPYAFVDPTPKSESAAAGSDALPAVLPVTANLLPPFTPTSDQPWLTIGAITNGVVSFSFTANAGLSRPATISLLGQTIPVAQALNTQGGPGTCSLGTTALLVGPTAGSNSVVLAVVPNQGTWTATTNTTWLHLSPANQSGAGSTNVVFSYDANSGPTRSGTLTIGGQTLTVTQAGSTYVVAPGPVTTLVLAGLNTPYAVAVDGAGNVYIADSGDSEIKKWTAANNTVTPLASSGGTTVAVDGAGNVYFTSGNSIQEWTAANSNVTTVVSAAANSVAVDGADNIYFTSGNSVLEWTAANSNLSTLVDSGLNEPLRLAVDGAGNVYIPDWGNNAIKEWIALNGNVTPLVSTVINPQGAAVDGAGNVYIADANNNAIKKWTAANSNVTTLVSSGLYHPDDVAVDGAGNVYIADSWNSLIKELPYAFIDPTPKLESMAAGNDSLPGVLPVTANLRAPFVPTSDQSWLTIDGVTNGVVSFSFTADSGSSRTAHITLLGQTVAVTQGIPVSSLSTTALFEGPGLGSDSVGLTVTPASSTWTATANAPWLHLSPANQSGAGSTNVFLSYDANTGATRSGTVSISGQTLSVTQAGSSYIAIGSPTTLVSSGLSQPWGVAVDGSGNVDIADKGNNSIEEWPATGSPLIIWVNSGLNHPESVAVDGGGNLYVADYGDNMLMKWTAATSSLSELLATGPNSIGVALDGADNVYFTDGAVREFTVTNLYVTTLASTGLNNPTGLAVGDEGNVYFADTGNNAIKMWTAASSNVATLVSSGLNNPSGVAVDRTGNVYIADTGNSAIKKWTAATSNVTTLAAAGLNSPRGVAVDGLGNVYIADTGNSAMEELPYAFVDPTARFESNTAGSDALAVVLPPTQNLLALFSPASDQSWLTINNIANGVVSFSFTANTGPTRTAHITLLGQTISIIQGVIGTPPTLTALQTPGNGVFQFSFTNNPSATFTVLSTTNILLPLANWAVVGTATNTAPGVFQFTWQPTNAPQSYFIVRSP
jgi:DNA-binding beta-propeller fold protein YncE